MLSYSNNLFKSRLKANVSLTLEAKMNCNLENKNALVGGGSQGIGKASAIELAKLGATVTIVARSEEKLKAALDALPTNHGQAHEYLVADFYKLDELREKLQKLLQRTVFHIFINNTGGPAGGPITEAKVMSFAEAFQQHIGAAQTIATMVLPQMKKESYGRIINVISTSVKEPIPGLGVSNTIRAAMGNWAKTWSQEVGTYGVTVNNVLPGYTQTGRLDNIVKKKAKLSNTSTDDIRIQMKRNVPMKRFGQPEEVATAIAFLASPAAGYINGINLPVDGGRTKSL